MAFHRRSDLGRRRSEGSHHAGHIIHVRGNGDDLASIERNMVDHVATSRPLMASDRSALNFSQLSTSTTLWVIIILGTVSPSLRASPDHDADLF